MENNNYCYYSDLPSPWAYMQEKEIEEKKNEIVPFISRYANSQNKVSELDLTNILSNVSPSNGYKSLNKIHLLNYLASVKKITFMECYKAF